MHKSFVGCTHKHLYKGSDSYLLTAFKENNANTVIPEPELAEQLDTKDKDALGLEKDLAHTTTETHKSAHITRMDTTVTKHRNKPACPRAIRRIKRKKKIKLSFLGKSKTQENSIKSNTTKTFKLQLVSSFF